MIQFWSPSTNRVLDEEGRCHPQQKDLRPLPKTPTNMPAILYGVGATTIAARERASWQIFEDKRRQRNNQPANERWRGGAAAMPRWGLGSSPRRRIVAATIAFA